METSADVGMSCSTPRQAFAKEGMEHSPTIRKRTQASGPAAPRSLETRDLDNLQVRSECSHVEQRFGAVRIVVQAGGNILPEGVVAIAQVGVHPAAQQLSQHRQAAIASLAQEWHVRGPAALHKPRSLGEISPGEQRAHECLNLAGIVRPVSIEFTMMSPVAADAGAERCTLAMPWLSLCACLPLPGVGLPPFDAPHS